jgi:coenzyme F420-reducing hydrogenase beta subunit
LDGLEQLRQSKYIQSEIGDCYSEISDKLNNDEHVLFCGTPCQVDGLQHFLGKEYEKLLLVDFVCHGVSSPVIFKKYIESLEQKEGARVKDLRFRDKVTKGNVSSIAYTTIVFENGKTRSSECNLYLRAYMSGLMQRSSCESCPFANRYRRSDITIGDFWGIEEILPQLKNEFHRGISLILSNTEKGRQMCEQLTNKMFITETEVSYAFNGKNAQLERPVKANERKEQLYENVEEIGVMLALAKGLGLRYLTALYYKCFINKVKASLPKRMYGWMVTLKHSLSN